MNDNHKRFCMPCQRFKPVEGGVKKKHYWRCADCVDKAARRENKSTNPDKRSYEKRIDRLVSIGTYCDNKGE